MLADDIRSPLPFKGDCRSLPHSVADAIRYLFFGACLLVLFSLLIAFLQATSLIAIWNQIDWMLSLSEVLSESSWFAER